MPTSGTTDYTTTRDDIIKRALRLIGATSQGETPTATQISEAAISLNSLVKAWAADGMPLWAITEKTITLVAGQSEYTVTTPKPLKVLQAWNRNTTSNVDIPMRVLTKQEYNMLGNKTSTGNPIQLYYDPRRDSGVFHLFPVPTSVEQTANVIHYVCQIHFEDFDASTDNPDFPQEWYDAITYGLATRLAPEYGIPTADRKVLWQEMSIIKQEALNFGLEEGSMYFQREFRSW